MEQKDIYIVYSVKGEFPACDVGPFGIEGYETARRAFIEAKDDDAIIMESSSDGDWLVSKTPTGDYLAMRKLTLPNTEQ